MKKATKIIIKNRSYTLKFGYGSTRLLGDFLGEDSFDGTADRVGKAVASLANQEKKGGVLSFETLDTLGYLILSGIQDHEYVSKEDEPLTKNDCVDFIFENMEGLKSILEAYAESMPKPKAKPVQKKTRAQTARARKKPWPGMSSKP